MKILVNVVHVISFCVLMLLGIVGIVYEIIGHGLFQQISAELGINNGFKVFWVLGVIDLFLLLLTYYIKIRKK